MIIYLHGFRSSPASRKARMIGERMEALGRGREWQCPALPVAPREAAEIALKAARDAQGDVALIGSSLGGYYATWVAEQLGVRAALLNPAIHPADDLAGHLGLQPVYFSDAQIELTTAHLQQLRELEVRTITRPERYFLLAATGDEVIDYRAMVAKYRGARQRIIEGSNHELSDFAGYLDEVLAFCGIADEQTTTTNLRQSTKGPL